MFRTRFWMLVAMVGLMVAPLLATAGYGLYLRSGMYAATVARQASAFLGAPVQIGGVVPLDTASQGFRDVQVWLPGEFNPVFTCKLAIVRLLDAQSVELALSDGRIEARTDDWDRASLTRLLAVAFAHDFQRIRLKSVRLSNMDLVARRGRVMARTSGASGQVDLSGPTGRADLVCDRVNGVQADEPIRIHCTFEPGVAARPATVDEMVPLLGAKPGSLGAVVNVPADIKIYADERLQGANEMTTGANEDGFHLKNVSIERDIKVTAWFDLRTVAAGEPCVKCGKSLKIRRAIEVGHVFKLGTKYSEKLNATFLDVDGSRKPPVMGCYGIGVTRTLQAVIEQGNDKDGVIWPLSVAPYQVCITPLAVAPESQAMQLAEKFYAELTAQGVDVILDDRDERPGVKFKDADLVGFPIRIALGEKSLAKGEVEIKPRSGPVQSVKIEAAVELVLTLAKV